MSCPHPRQKDNVMKIFISTMLLGFLCFGCQPLNNVNDTMFNNATVIADGTPAAVAPDGSTIALVRYDASSEPQIYCCGSNGENPHSITDGRYPSFSPDGKSIVFVRWYSVDYRRSSTGWVSLLMKINLETLQETRIVPDTIIAQVDDIHWSPDGENISYRYNNNIVIVSSDGTGMIRRTLQSDYFQWSPDGKQYFYTDLLRKNLYIRNLVSDAVTQVSTTMYYNAPVWLSDGNTIANLFISQDVIVFHSITQNTDSIVAEKLPAHPESTPGPVLSPSGQYIVYTVGDNLDRYDEPTTFHLEWYDISGKIQTEVAFQNYYFGNILWSPASRVFYFTVASSSGKTYRYSLP